MPIYAGLDIGSRSAKGLILNDTNKTDWAVIETEPDIELTARKVFDKVLEKAELSRKDVDYTVATGYGRVIVSFADTVTEITCHAKGAVWLDPEVRLVLDVGGQDSKAIRCDENGRVVNFALNEKCAAGTGRYLERIAETIGVPVSELGALALKGSQPVTISSVCAVFAQNEIAGYLRDGKSLADVVAGACQATVRRQVSLLRKVGLGGHLMFCGGVAKNIGVVKILEDKLGEKVVIPSEPQIVGALGAAAIARDRAKKRVLAR